MTIHPIHPFPARMAPEIVLEQINALPLNSVILDPMSGSGTVVRVASEKQHTCFAYDMDPLAVLMAKVWTTPISCPSLLKASDEVVKAAESLKVDDVYLPWIDDDQETQKYIDFWFAPDQRDDLRRLSSALFHNELGIADDILHVLKIGLSRLIITKDRGASLARDVSHSRPHRVRTSNDFSVFKEFPKVINQLQKRLSTQPPQGNVSVEIGDARSLDGIQIASIDAVITSPPYLNAIDYTRGHKLSLVWLGYQVSDVRPIRQESIGAERRPANGANLELAQQIRERIPSIDLLPQRNQKMIDRYSLDMFKVVTELYRVIKPQGKAILVVGNSCIKDVFVDNATIVSVAAELAGFEVTGRRERDLPTSKRYLPPPTTSDISALKKRMRTEAVLTFTRL